VNPLIEVPRQTPTSLSVVVGPVFVTADPARTEKLAAVLRLMAEGPEAFAPPPAIAPIAMSNAMPTIAANDFDLFKLDAPLDAHARGVSVSVGWSMVRSSAS